MRDLAAICVRRAEILRARAALDCELAVLEEEQSKLEADRQPDAQDEILDTAAAAKYVGESKRSLCSKPEFLKARVSRPDAWKALFSRAELDRILRDRRARREAEAS